MIRNRMKLTAAFSASYGSQARPSLLPTPWRRQGHSIPPEKKRVAGLNYTVLSAKASFATRAERRARTSSTARRTVSCSS